MSEEESILNTMLKLLDFLIPVAAFFLAVVLWRRRSSGGTIPGPPGYPLIGNLLDWPSDYQAEHMAEWQKKYGPIVKLSVLGKTVLFLTSPEAISELFAKRSLTFSDRPHFIFSEELCGMKVLHPMTQYGEDFRQQRKLMKEVLAGDVIRRHQALLDDEGRRMLQGLLKTPQECDRLLRRFSSSLSLRMVYGFEAMEIDDPHVMLAEEMMQLAEYAVIGGWLVDFFPSIQYLPKWFPGTGWRARADYYRGKITEMITTPYEEVRQLLQQGKANDSFCSINMRKSVEGEHAFSEGLIKATATAIYGGASDTTGSAAWSFMLAMLLHPEVQAKAQAEIDRVTERTRLPRMSDKNDMPFLVSIVWETFRWSPPVPVTLPHRNRNDEMFMGHFIPKDTMMVASLWSITRDPSFHNNADEFNPDRYEIDGERIPYYVFGYGHRRCPGADMAFAQLFHQASFILSCFTLSPKLDAKGKPIIPEPKFAGEMVRKPEPFPYNIAPRWEGVESLFQE